MIRITIPLVGPSSNEMYAGMNRYKRAKLARDWHMIIKAIVLSEKITPVTSYPVTIRISCYFGPGEKRYDWDNLSFTAKLIQDSLVYARILKGDSPRYISQGSLVPLRTKEPSHTLVEISPL